MDWLESRAHIADLVHRYANHIIAGQYQQCAALFTAQAIFEVRQAKPGASATARMLNRAEGVEAIVAYLARSGSGSVCPMIHNLTIDISGDEANSSCIMAATVWAGGQVLIGQYADTYGRDREWRFTSRTYTIFRA